MSYAATIGFFDGVHSGHRYLISRLRDVAAERGLQSAIITFEKHPLTIITGERKPLLTIADERINLLKQQQPDEIFCFNFEVIKDFTAAEFLHVLHNQCNVSTLLMGYDHRFGSDRLSLPDDYNRVASVAGISLIWSDEYTENQHHVSSTRIRSFLAEGNITEANMLLGYRYNLTGNVVHGNKIGRRIGFPTANISVPEDKLIPMNGVYAVEVETADGKCYSGVLNIGIRPTIGEGQRTIEVHIIGCRANLYEQELTIRFCRFLRAEQKFATLEELRCRIEEDLKHIR